MIQNLQTYVKGSFLWVAHYNNEDPIDETSLPPWAWLVRDTNVTLAAPGRLRLFGISKALSFALQSDATFKHVLTLSSGSAFFKEFQVPTSPRICLDTYETVFHPNAKLPHAEAIPVEHSGQCAKYLHSIGAGPWQYANGDLDTDLQQFVQKRGFAWFRGSQWSGQMWPCEVARMLVEDIQTIYNSPNTPHLKYASEEIYLSTYAYNYGITHSIPIERSEVIINWNTNYLLSDPRYIDDLRTDPRFRGHAVCKLSDDIQDPLRRYIQEYTMNLNSK